jgi:hypothetical protein
MQRVTIPNDIKPHVVDTLFLRGWAKAFLLKKHPSVLSDAATAEILMVDER